MAEAPKPGSENSADSGDFHHVRWLFHPTAMVEDYESARDGLTRQLGLRVLEDTAIADPEVGRRGGMAFIGDHSVELGQPFGPVSPIRGFLDRFGPGLHSFGLQVTDLDATVAHLHRLDVRIVARSEEFSFVFCDPRDTGGILVQFASVEMPFDPRFGAAVPEPTGQVDRNVSALGWIEATSPEPEATAERLNTVIAAGRDLGPATVDLGSCELRVLASDGARPRLSRLVFIDSDHRDERLDLAADATGGVPVSVVGPGQV